MTVLGIDPGYAIIGYGFVEYNAGKFKPLKYGALTTAKDVDFSKRLEYIFDGMNEILDDIHPDAISIEKLYFNTNTTTAIAVAEARGVILLAAQKKGIPIFEYTPLQVKQSVTGYGRSEKKQVMDMTRRLLNLSAVPKPDDTADALALAICHAHSCGSFYGKLYMEAKSK